MSEPLNRISRRITQPKSQGASQAMLYATGLSEADIHKAPVGSRAHLETDMDPGIRPNTRLVVTMLLILEMRGGFESAQSRVEGLPADAEFGRGLSRGSAFVPAPADPQSTALRVRPRVTRQVHPGVPL